ncbi:MULTISPECIES: sigma-70 family RNA polymerase sigma factor [unclassified Halomonas]|uniref:sigma-70 family RNA polymerase sigma factor n=1 Tax=unclassified Halomonas TaxID=2609666 RepID=UPI0021E38A01|nr:MULTISPECIES: sigma-70 family RNA polymerase sigma factor [unclassified Halomonas]UYG01215.1 sigma-70 family RNA polymerase sigma factor [Halomonas sp. GD1P12]WNL37724.1 sigma-70 family RNA polymerase sigma factor [Halomonas sp. PAMB 3232]WNL41039.1 sigma-70 family RNA polymerase sigma factor [Halomonas sp. PAMB 3264]
MAVSENINELDVAETLRRCTNGEQEALHALYRQEGARMLGVVLRIVKDRGMAEDIVHDAFLSIWQRADTFDPQKGAARTWIYSIARHLALNAIRRRDLSGDEVEPDTLEQQDVRRPEGQSVDAFDWQTGQRMDECLKELDVERRNCVLQAYVDGLSHAEIAAHTGAPLGTVKAWIKRSLVRLRECLA